MSQNNLNTEGLTAVFIDGQYVGKVIAIKKKKQPEPPLPCIISPILKLGDLVFIKEEYLEDLGLSRNSVTDVYNVKDIRLSKNKQSLLLVIGTSRNSREEYEVTSEMIDKFGEIS